jgi:hypothetical protein
MRLCHVTMPRHARERDYSATLEEEREAVLFAQAPGCGEALAGEHVSDRAETIASCLAFSAAAAG